MNVSHPEIPCLELEERDRAYQKVLRMASVRELSSAKAQEKLQLAGYSQEAIAFAIEKASSYRFIDDKRYADALIRNRVSAGKGLSFALREIESLGVDPYTLDSYNDYLESGEDSEVNRAVELLERKPPKSKNKRDGAYRRLLQAGFSSSTASQAARRWCEAQAQSEAY